MRRTLLGLAAATLAVTALPALAETAPALQACPGVADADRLTLAGKEQAVTAAVVPDPRPAAAADVPQAQPSTTRRLVLDLAGQPAGTTATVGAVLTWGQFVNDYDLRLRSGDATAASQEVNPETMQAREETALAELAHCSTLTVTVRNYLAAPDSLTLALAPTVDEALDEE